MRIEKLTLKNFRGFEELEIDFPEEEGGLAVFIGVNGSGKTSVLDSISYFLLSLIDIYIAHPENYKLKSSIYLEDISIDSLEANSKIIIEGLAEFKFSIYSFFEDIRFEVSPNSQGIPKSDKIKYLEDLTIPVVAYYQTDRRISTNPSLKSKSLKKVNSKEYSQTINEIVNFDYFFEWFRNTEDYENEQRLHLNSNYRHPALEAFRKAVTVFLTGYINPRVQRQPRERLVVDKKNIILSITQLSHGEKLIFAILGDIIRRISTYNPGTQIPLLEKGIILIDEIEQHLHPSWQRTIIPNLRNTFPNIQFIVTTHSPQVLSNVKRENVFILEDFKLVEKTPFTYGKDTNSILYNLFGVKPRPEHAKKDFNKLYRLLDDPKKEEDVKKMIKDLEKKYGENDPDLLEVKLNFEFMTR